MDDQAWKLQMCKDMQLINDLHAQLEESLKQMMDIAPMLKCKSPELADKILLGCFHAEHLSLVSTAFECSPREHDDGMRQLREAVPTAQHICNQLCETLIQVVAATTAPHVQRPGVSTVANVAEKYHFRSVRFLSGVELIERVINEVSQLLHSQDDQGFRGADENVPNRFKRMRTDQNLTVTNDTNKMLEGASIDSYEAKLKSDIFPPDKIDVALDDIGALKETKILIHELVILPIRRPELFKGRLLKPCKGILLFGPPGTGKTMLAKAIAKESHANFINVSLANIFDKWMGESEKNVKALFTLAAKVAPSVIFVDEVDSFLGKRTSAENDSAYRKVKNEFMSLWDGLTTDAGKQVLVLGATNRPFDLDEAIVRRFERRILVDLPCENSRELILKKIIGEDVQGTVDFKKLAIMTKGYSGSDLKNLCVAAAYQPLRELLEKERLAPNGNIQIEQRPINMDDILQAMNQVAVSFTEDGPSMLALRKWNDLHGEGSRMKTDMKQKVPDNSYEANLMSNIVAPDEVDVTLDDIGSVEEIKKFLYELVILPIRRPEVFKGGLLKPCKGVLLFGPPGTGKTMLAKAIAKECRANFINVSLASIFDMWMGESEKNVKALFTLATKLAPTVIFLDEVDSLLGRRTSNEFDSAYRKVKNEFMSLWDGLRTKSGEQVLVLGATNRPFDLDEAIIRRFEQRIFVDLPCKMGRETILRKILAKEKVDTMDFEELALITEGYSGSDLKNLCTTAAYRPLRELLEHEQLASTVSQSENKSGAQILRPLSGDDIKQAQKQVAASLSADGSSMLALKKWNHLYGVGGNKLN